MLLGGVPQGVLESRQRMRINALLSAQGLCWDSTHN